MSDVFPKIAETFLLCYGIPVSKCYLSLRTTFLFGLGPLGKGKQTRENSRTMCWVRVVRAFNEKSSAWPGTFQI